MSRLDVYTSKDRDDELQSQIIFFFFKWCVPLVLIMLYWVKWTLPIIGIVWLGFTLYFSFFRKKRK